MNETTHSIWEVKPMQVMTSNYLTVIFSVEKRIKVFQTNLKPTYGFRLTGVKDAETII